MEAYDINPLIQPIPGPNPVGETLRYSSLYDDIREARRQEDATLPQGVWQTEVKRADWDRVIQLCTGALQNKSKDLQIAAWLTEAWMHMEGPMGLARGLDVIYALSDTYWDDVYPQPDKTGYDLRLVPYEWLNNKLSDETQCVLISMPSDRTSLPFRMMDWNDANRLELSARFQKDRERVLKEAEDEKRPTLSAISLSVDQTPTAFYRYMDKGASQSLAALSRMDLLLRDHLDAEAPSFYRLREKLEGIQRLAQGVLKDRGEKADQQRQVLANGTEVQGPGLTRRSGPIKTREEAYARLAEAAAFLAKVEPHSPTPYLVRRAIAWEGMSLVDVIQDVMRDGRDMSVFLDLLKITDKERQNMMGGAGAKYPESVF